MPARKLFSCRRIKVLPRTLVSGGACGMAVGVAVQDFAVGFAVAIALILAFSWSAARASHPRCLLFRHRT